jgi:hypothetical protein
MKDLLLRENNADQMIDQSEVLSTEKSGHHGRKSRQLQF